MQPSRRGGGGGAVLRCIAVLVCYTCVWVYLLLHFGLGIPSFLPVDLAHVRRGRRGGGGGGRLYILRVLLYTYDILEFWTNPILLAFQNN